MLRATATRIATLGRLVSQALSLRVLRAAEDGDLNPEVVTPNRISSAISRHAGSAASCPRSYGNAGQACREGSGDEHRTRMPETCGMIVRALCAQVAGYGHSASPFPTSGAWTRMRSIVVRAMPVRRCTSALLGPAWKAIRTASSRRSVTDCRSDTHAASISRACRTVSSGRSDRMLRFCSAYCKRSASPITGREAIRVRSHGSRNGTGRSCFRACRGAGTNPEVEAVMLGLPLNGRSRLPGPRAHRRGPASGRRRDLPPCICQRSTRRYTVVWCISQCIESVRFG